MATTKHGAFIPEFKADDSHFEIVGKTKEMIRKKKIISPDTNKMFCVEFNDLAKTKRYTNSEKRYKELLKMKNKPIS